MLPVLAYHLVITGYGFWLPNDPRGSWSDFVRAFELLRFGHATKIKTRRSVAGRKHDQALRREAKRHLARDPVEFSGVQARAVARGFANYVTRSELDVRACAIMPNHAHLVVMRHRYLIEQIANLLKGAATTELAREQMHPFAGQPYSNGKLPSPWARKEWSVFLSTPEEIDRAIEYVDQNPIEQGLKPQHWSFVRPCSA